MGRDQPATNNPEDFAGRGLEGTQREGIGNVKAVSLEETSLIIPVSAKCAKNTQRTARRMALKWLRRTCGRDRHVAASGSSGPEYIYFGDVDW